MNIWDFYKPAVVFGWFMILGTILYVILPEMYVLGFSFRLLVYSLCVIAGVIFYGSMMEEWAEKVAKEKLKELMDSLFTEEDIS